MNRDTKFFRFVFISLAAGLLVPPLAGAAAKSPEPPPAVPVAVEQAVLETNVAMMAAANRLDADAFFDFILDSDQGSIVQNGVLFKSRAEALAAVKRGFEGMAKLDRRLEHPRVTVISADCALLTAEGSTAAVLKDGRMLNSRFAVSLVFVRRDGGWKVLHGHYSTPGVAGQ